MKINTIRHCSYEMISYFQEPLHIIIFRGLYIGFYLDNPKYTQICNHINCEYIENFIDIFQYAAEKGYLGVCKWLYNTYDLTKKNATRFSNVAFRWASAKGH